MDLNKVTRKQLLALPVREWDKRTTYDSVLIVPQARAHDSGWAMMYIVGVREGVPVEIAATHCDDIEWIVNADKWGSHRLRMDCVRTARCTHVWSNHLTFAVGASLSSVDITALPRP